MSWGGREGLYAIDEQKRTDCLPQPDGSSMAGDGRLASVAPDVHSPMVLCPLAVLESQA